MKKLAVLLAFVLLLSCIPLRVHAAPYATLTGPGTVRAGDTITLSFTAGGGIYGGEGSLSYDSSLLTLQGCSASIGGSWLVEFSGNNFVFYDNSMKSPIQGSAVIFTATFQVNSTAATGAAVTVSASTVLSDGNQDFGVGSPSYSTTIAPPLSDNCNLGALQVSNATITPAFSPDVTSYTASVPFTVSALQISTAAADTKATVSMNNPNLPAGGSATVTITVTAENGATKTYTIRVDRAQDPNYVKSSDTTLGSLSVEGFQLSPVFSTGTTRYIVWLPYETETVTVNATAGHALAKATVGAIPTLEPGIGKDVAITVTAEDGTQQVYTLTVFRAPAHEDVDDFLGGARETVPTEPATEPTEVTEPATEPTTEPTEAPDPTFPTEPLPQQKENTIALRAVILIAIICLAAGFLICIPIKNYIDWKRYGGYSYEDEDDTV